MTTQDDATYLRAHANAVKMDFAWNVVGDRLLEIADDFERLTARLEWRDDPERQNRSTHSESCWQWHHGCAMAAIERLTEERDAAEARAAALAAALGPPQVIRRIAEIAHAIGWQAGVGGMETAGGIVSYLAQHPEHTAAAMEDGMFAEGISIDWPHGHG